MKKAKPSKSSKPKALPYMKGPSSGKKVSGYKINKKGSVKYYGPSSGK